jgi:hypothetical protein
MFFPTTFLVSLLAVSPVFSAPVLNAAAIDSNVLAARDLSQQTSLHVRSEGYGLDTNMMEKRDLAGGELFDQLVARSPMPLGEEKFENMERRGWLGTLMKIGKSAFKARSIDRPVELGLRDFDEPELEARDAEELEIEARSFDEPELETRDIEELEARAFEEEEF